MAAIINSISIRAKTISALTSNKYKGLAKLNAERKFNAAKDDLLEDFDTHQVTKELLQNPKIEGSELVDRGNLVTLLGIEDGKEEVENLRNYLDKNIKLDKSQPKITTERSKITYHFKINIPNKESIYDKFPSPNHWSSRSWLELIEKGVNNVVLYFFSKRPRKTSRSGYGLQLHHFYADGKFTPMKYISGLFNDFRNRFK